VTLWCVFPCHILHWSAHLSGPVIEKLQIWQKLEFYGLHTYPHSPIREIWFAKVNLWKALPHQLWPWLVHVSPLRTRNHKFSNFTIFSNAAAQNCARGTSLWGYCTPKFLYIFRFCGLRPTYAPSKVKFGLLKCFYVWIILLSKLCSGCCRFVYCKTREAGQDVTRWYAKISLSC